MIELKYAGHRRRHVLLYDGSLYWLEVLSNERTDKRAETERSSCQSPIAPTARLGENGDALSMTHVLCVKLVCLGRRAAW